MKIGQEHAGLRSAPRRGKPFPDKSGQVRLPPLILPCGCAAAAGRGEREDRAPEKRKGAEGRFSRAPGRYFPFAASRRPGPRATSEARPTAAGIHFRRQTPPPCRQTVQRVLHKHACSAPGLRFGQGGKRKKISGRTVSLFLRQSLRAAGVLFLLSRYRAGT